MARARDRTVTKHIQIWLKHSGNITNRQIVEQLGIDEKRSPAGSSMINGM
ncbi:hypothetical protein [Paenibacillus sp. NPDC057934]